MEKVLTGCLGIILVIVLVATITAVFTMWLWNWVMVDVMSMPTISWTEAWGINVLSAILFKSTSTSTTD